MKRRIASDLQNFIVFRQKLLAPSEHFIPTCYVGFDAMQPIWLADRYEEHAHLLSGEKLRISGSTIRRALYYNFGTGADLDAVSRHRPVLVHAHFGKGGALALPLARRLGLALAVTFHGGDATKETHYRKRLFPSIYQRRLRALKQYADLFVCVSDFVRRKLLALDFPDRKMVVNPIGIEVRDRLDRAEQRGVVHFVGRLVEKKGVADLIRAASQLSDSAHGGEIRIIGDGPLRTELELLAADLGAPVRFLGWQEPAEVRRQLARSQLLVVPSCTAESGDSEGLPTVALEAMAAGLPVVGTDHGGIPEAVRHGETGLIVPERDPNALGKAIVHIIENPELGRRFGEAGHARARAEFNAAVQLRRLQKLFQEMVFGRLEGDREAMRR